MKFKGGECRIKTSGAAKINMVTECEFLECKQSGASKIKVSGTADNTQIKGSGASFVDLSNLNKF
jgi:hypothetical protein